MENGRKSESKSSLRHYHNMEVRSFRIAALALSCASLLAAQPVDDTKVKQVIILGRHGVRSPVVDNNTLNNFSTQPFPVFSVPGVSNLTINGATNETILGGYFRLWLTQEGMLTGKDSADASSVYFRANNARTLSGVTRRAWCWGAVESRPPGHFG